MVTDWPDCLGQRNTSRFPLKKVLPEALSWSAPCWPEEQPDGHPQLHLHLGGLQLRKEGRGNNFGSCAIKVDLDSLRKFLVLLPEENRPISGGLRKDLVDYLLVDCGSVVIVTVSTHSPSSLFCPSHPPFLSFTPQPSN